MILKTDTVLLIIFLLQFTGDTSLRYYIVYYIYLIAQIYLTSVFVSFQELIQ